MPDPEQMVENRTFVRVKQHDQYGVAAFIDIKTANAFEVTNSGALIVGVGGGNYEVTRVIQAFNRNHWASAELMVRMDDGEVKTPGICNGCKKLMEDCDCPF